MIVAALACLLPSCGFAMNYDKSMLTYTSDLRGYEEAQVAEAFDAAATAGTPIVLFVHGRGDEPGKSLEGTGFILRSIDIEGRAVAKLEAYGTRVVMFSWDSKRGGFKLDFNDRKRPRENVPEASRRLGKVLASFRNWSAARPAHPPVVLLVHSMGSLVLQKCLDDGLWPVGDGTRLFSAVILTAADADDIGHDAWLRKLPHDEAVYVTLNPGDHILKDSTEHRPAGAAALGRGMRPGMPLAPNATYVDLHTDSRTAQKFQPHEIFNKCAARGHAQIARFFDDLFHQRTPEIGTAAATRGRRLALADDRATSGPVFAGANCGD